MAIEHNKLSTIDVTDCEQLTFLSIFGNDIKEMSDIKCTGAMYLALYNGLNKDVKICSGFNIFDNASNTNLGGSTMSYKTFAKLLKD